MATNNEAYDWFSPVSSLKGVGEKIAEKLIKLDIFTVGDLLLHCPFRYEDRTHVTPIQNIQAEQWVLIQGSIIQAHIQSKGRKRCAITLKDQSGSLQLVFFHFQPNQQYQWKVGNTLRCYGQVKEHHHGLQIVHPEYEVIDEAKPQPLPWHLTPVYPTVAGLWQGWLRKMIFQVLEKFNFLHAGGDPFAERLPDFALPTWMEALNTIHRPSADQNLIAILERTHPAYQRLILEELFAHHTSMRKLKEQLVQRKSPKLLISEKLKQQFLNTLPFKLTPAQARVCAEINEDLSNDTPMLRLVQGDVGCGKTVVAAMAALGALEHQNQVAIMVPTEILAEQHFEQFNNWFSPLGYRCEILTGKLKAKARRSALENLQMGLTHVVIGTHALFQDEVQFKKLGLVIIDEQHRFGVHQRLALQAKGIEGLFPHQLIMTATPIPRTLAMSHYAHLDISVIDSLPPGRQPIVTLAISQSKRETIIDRISHICEKGQQVYWVCTLITESDTLQCQAAETSAALLQSLLPKYKIGLVHGKMDAQSKESIMHSFHKGETAVLVATTVIEVGVNVPNATLMVVENPERLGLAQLHQLRGRVGRGKEASYCLLLYQSPLSEMAQSRLSILRDSQDGFLIAQADLELRGPGEVLGLRQTGMIRYKIADLARDKAFFHSLSDWKEKLKDLPEVQIERIMARWCQSSHYAHA